MAVGRSCVAGVLAVPPQGLLTRSGYILHWSEGYDFSRSALLQAVHSKFAGEFSVRAGLSRDIANRIFDSDSLFEKNEFV
jgi:hypothetical protein